MVTKPCEISGGVGIGHFPRQEIRNTTKAEGSFGLLNKEKVTEQLKLRADLGCRVESIGKGILDMGN